MTEGTLRGFLGHDVNVTIHRADEFLAKKAGAIRTLAKNVMRDVIEIGRHLTEAKNACRHGQWLPWLEKEFAWSETQARRYMQVHAQFGKSSNLADLGPLDVSTLYLLAAPSTPAEIRGQALERAGRGELLTHAEVKKMIADAADGLAPEREGAMVDEAAARERQSAISYRTVIYYPALNIARLAGGVVTPEDMAAVMIKHAALFVDDVTGEPIAAQRS